jgi:ribosomal protein S18 acetylase RimI-like enzyme
MTADDAGDTGRPWDVTADARPSADARILRRAIRESVATSPDSFLRTVSDIDAKPSGYWEKELRSATWAVIQRGNKVLGIAAAKQPSDEDVKEFEHVDRSTSRFIESVWIDPSIRGRGFGERLVRYLIEIEREMRIQRFLLWVLVQNSPAIKLYERMDFKWMDHEKPHGSGKIESLYMRLYDSAEAMATELDGNKAAREQDWEDDRVRYRLLGGEVATSSPKYSKASSIESTRGSLVR